MKDELPTLGVIGGSGLYALEGLEDVRETKVKTPFGEASDAIVSGRLGGTRLLFLPRHGRGHRLAPHRIDYRANVFALKKLGAQQILSVSAVGSLREDLPPGDLVLVDQYIDRTRGRPSTFFDAFGIVAHVGFSDPTDPALGEAVRLAAVEVGARIHVGGTYVCMDGPQFSTRAESELYRGWKAHVIGMTNLPEAKLAREAELPYASLALVTDYDCWHQTEASVHVEAVIQVLQNNVATARRILHALAPRLPDASKSPAASALANAIITAPEHVSASTRTALAPLIGKYLPVRARARRPLKRLRKGAERKRRPRSRARSRRAGALRAG